MTKCMEQIHKMNDCTYGRSRVQAELRDMGFRINHKCAGRLMRSVHIKGISRRRSYIVTTERDRHAK